MNEKKTFWVEFNFKTKVVMNDGCTKHDIISGAIQQMLRDPNEYILADNVAKVMSHE